MVLHWYAMLASFLGTGVEFVEALTIVLAVGSIRGWKSALYGAISAAIVLGLCIAIIGAPLVQVIQVAWVQLLVGLFMLLFGIRWLRKAILRYSGLKALHNESESYKEEVERQQKAGAVAETGIDRFAFATTFSGTFLEGMEAIFIVITFGLSIHVQGGGSALSSTIWGAVIATIVVVALGVALRAPLSKVPENTMKFIVGVMLTSFGAFWVGEGLHVSWPQADVSILYMVIVLCLLSYLLVSRIKRMLSAKSQVSATTESMGVTK